MLEAGGLRDEVVRPHPPMTRWVHLGGRTLKAPSIQLLARAGIGRALVEPLFARPLREDLPLRAFLEQRLGRRAGGLAATVMSAGVYAATLTRCPRATPFLPLASWQRRARSCCRRSVARRGLAGESGPCGAVSAACRRRWPGGWEIASARERE